VSAGGFRANDIDYEGSWRIPHEQVDGSLFCRGFTYMVEARWRQHKPTINDLADFKFKVDGTRGRKSRRRVANED
jgi:hypothetical protein